MNNFSDKKTPKTLKDILNSNQVDYAIEAHNGISAKIAEITNIIK